MANTKAQMLRKMQQLKAKAKQINKKAAMKRKAVSASGTAETGNKPLQIKLQNTKLAVPVPKPSGANQSGKKTFTNADLKRK